MKGPPLIQQINYHKYQLKLQHINALLIKKKYLIILVSLLLTINQAYAKTMICVIPNNSLTRKLEANSYIELLEAKTKIEFDISDKIGAFRSPGCHKTKSIAYWATSLEISCNSNSAQSVSLKINLSTLKFEKTYSENYNKIHKFYGFCLIPNP